MTTARDYILILTCDTPERAAEIESAFDNIPFCLGVSAERKKVFLHQLEAEKPYDEALIKEIKQFAKSWYRLSLRLEKHSKNK